MLAEIVVTAIYGNHDVCRVSQQLLEALTRPYWPRKASKRNISLSLTADTSKKLVHVMHDTDFRHGMPPAFPPILFSPFVRNPYRGNIHFRTVFETNEFYQGVNNNIIIHNRLRVLTAATSG